MKLRKIPDGIIEIIKREIYGEIKKEFPGEIPFGIHKGTVWRGILQAIPKMIP